MMIPIRMYDNSMLEYMFVQRFDDNKIDRFKYEEIFFYDVEHAFEFISLFDWEDNCSYYWRDLLQDLDEYSYAIHRMTDEQVIERLAIMFADSDIKAFKLIKERQDGDDYEYLEEVVENEVSDLADNRAIRKPILPKKIKDWVEIELLDDDGNPVAGEEYVIILPDKTRVRGNLNDKGKAKHTGIDSGTCKVFFPSISGDNWGEKVPAEKSSNLLEIKLIDEEDNPVPNEQYKVTLPDKSIREGKLSKHGCAKIWAKTPGKCKVSFPDIGAEDWQQV